MVSHQRPGDCAPSPGPQGEGQERHQRCVRGPPSGQGEVPDVRGGEERDSGVEGGGHLRPAAAAAWRRRRRIRAQHAAGPGPSPGSGGPGQAAGAGGHQPAATERGHHPQ